jgi:hypothetical protein
MKNIFTLIIILLFNSFLIAKDRELLKKNDDNIQYDHDPMRTYLANDQLALDTEIMYAKAIRLQMVAYWEETAKIYMTIANRGHPIAQLHLGKQYVHGNGVKKSLVDAYKWFSLSETEIGKHYIEEILKDMSEKEVISAKNLIKKFKPLYK